MSFEAIEARTLTSHLGTYPTAPAPRNAGSHAGLQSDAVNHAPSSAPDPLMTMLAGSETVTKPKADKLVLRSLRGIVKNSAIAHKTASDALTAHDDKANFAKVSQNHVDAITARQAIENKIQAHNRIPPTGPSETAGHTFVANHLASELTKAQLKETAAFNKVTESRDFRANKTPEDLQTARNLLLKEQLSKSKKLESDSKVLSKYEQDHELPVQKTPANPATSGNTTNSNGTTKSASATPIKNDEEQKKSEPIAPSDLQKKHDELAAKLTTAETAKTTAETAKTTAEADKAKAEKSTKTMKIVAATVGGTAAVAIPYIMWSDGKTQSKLKQDNSQLRNTIQQSGIGSN